MRASKEEAKNAICDLAYLRHALTDQNTGNSVNYPFDRIQEFLEAAQRKLPTDAAYDREATKRNVGRRAKR